MVRGDARMKMGRLPQINRNEHLLPKDGGRKSLIVHSYLRKYLRMREKLTAKQSRGKHRWPDQTDQQAKMYEKLK